MCERFAPSPTGLLHLGHAFSALTAWDAARQSGAGFRLRIEDIDISRARPEFEAAIYRDLAWLGLQWPRPVMRQSERMPAYKDALNILIKKDLCYPCSCTRRDIATALAAPQEGSDGTGVDGQVYPGTCRNRPISSRTDKDAIRLNMAIAIRHLGGDAAIKALQFVEIGGTAAITHRLDAGDLMTSCGDIVLARRDIGTSYHLAVVVDDAAESVSTVTRGRDMFEATRIHRLLQALLGLPTPGYRHHRLIRDVNGKRLAKRDDARSIDAYRAAGKSVADIRHLLGL